MRVLLLAVVLALGLSTTAHACSCAAPSGDPRAEIAESSAAVFGKVVERTRKGDRVTGEFVYRLRVLADYKGNLGRYVKVRTAGNSATCGFHLREGGRIGLLLHRAGGRYHGSLCGIRSRQYLEGDASAAARTSRALCRTSRPGARTGR